MRHESNFVKSSIHRKIYQWISKWTKQNAENVFVEKRGKVCRLKNISIYRKYLRVYFSIEIVMVKVLNRKDSLKYMLMKAWYSPGEILTNGKKTIVKSSKVEDMSNCYFVKNMFVDDLPTAKHFKWDLFPLPKVKVLNDSGGNIMRVTWIGKEEKYA